MKVSNRIFFGIVGWLLFFSAVLPVAEAQTVIRGPYLQTGTPSDVIIKWRTDIVTDSVVRYGPDPASLTLSQSDPTSTAEHEVQLTGLSADTKYFYSVGTSSATLAGGDSNHFALTSPISGTAKATRIWAIGDSGTADANARAVRDAFLNFTGSQDADLWIMLGDNAYADGTDAQYQAAVFDTYPQLLTKTVLWTTLGNHDGHTADSASESGPYYDIFSLPRNGEAGGVPSGTEAYYSFDYGNIHFICLESYETDRSPSGAMMTWLEADLQANDKEWVVAFWHHPPYTKGSHDSDTEGQLVDMRQNAVPILEQYGVDLVLTGHSHSYERSYLIDGHYGVSSTFTEAMKVDPGDGSETGGGAYQKPGIAAAPHAGAVYAVAGSSGKTSGGSLNHPVMVVSMSVLGSMVLDVNGNRLDAKFLDGNGNILDDFTMLKGPDTTPPEISSVEAVGAPTQVVVAFSEGVEQVSAEAASNYAIDNGVTVSAASLGADGRTVALTTTPLTQGIAYTLTVNNVVDLASNPIAANSQAQFQYFNIISGSFQDGVAPNSGYAGTSDTYLSENAPTSNFGSSAALVLDGNDPSPTGNDLVTVIKWDTSSIPAGSLVDSAQIAIDVFDASTGSYEIYEMKRYWIESEATWNIFAAGNNWQTPGANGPLDRGSTVLGAVTASAVGPYTISLGPDALTLVQSWIDTPGSNNGLIIANTTTGNGLDFRSSEYGTATSRPKLTISYSPSVVDTESPSAPSGLQTTGNTDTTVSLQWNASTDNVAVTEYKIYRDGVEVGSTSGLTHTDTALTASTSYDYHVTALDAAINESGSSNVVTVVTDTLPPGGGITISFQDGVSPDTGYAGTRDGYISQNSPASDFGSSVDVLLDGDDPPGSGNDLSALLKWDVSSIPAGSIVESVEIEIEVFNVSSGPYELYEAKRNWVEAGASWNNYSVGNPWETAGAQGANDRGSTALGAVVAGVTGPSAVTLNAAGVALVQGWVDNPATNQGLIAANSTVTNGLDFRSREYATATLRPKLTIVYSSAVADTENPSAPANLLETGKSDTTVSLGWTASADNVGVTEYAVYRDGVEVGTTAGTSYNDAGLNPNTSYGYYVTARDAAGNESGPSGTVFVLTDPPPNALPTVSITSPADGTAVIEGTNIPFAGTATDAEDGDIAAGLSWISSLDGGIGFGGSFSTILSVGVHTITASILDSGGAAGSDVITVTVSASGSTQQFDTSMAWPLCGRISENPPGGWVDTDGCPAVRWGDPGFSDLPVFSPFGPRQLASEGGRYDFHRGIDLATQIGTPVFAVADGTVKIAGAHPSYSDPLVQLRHFRPGEASCNSVGCYHSNYMHLSQVVVAEDDAVSKGDLVGYTGASASGFEHLHFEIRNAPAFDVTSRWQRDAIDSLGVLSYQDASGATITFDSVDTSNPSQPVAALTVQTSHVDVQRVELTLLDSAGGVIPQPGNAANAEGYNVNPSWFGTDEWNYQYTHKDGTDFPWESFGAGGVIECPYHAEHPASYDAHIHMDKQKVDPQDPQAFEIGLFNGVELFRPPISGGVYSLQLTFHELQGVADCITAEVFFSSGSSSTASWGNCPGGNTPPTVSITAPADGSSFIQGTSVAFAGTANDAEDGDKTADLSWSSSIDSGIGSAGSFSISTLSVGVHTITASVTDSGGLSASDIITVTIMPNTPPVVTITSPADGSSFAEGTSIAFAGTAIDAETGDLTLGLSWVSNLDNAIGIEGGFSTTSLSVGTHVITASVTDSGGLLGSAVVNVTVEALPPSGLTIEQLVVPNVSNTAWTPVSLANTYGSMVVVCSANYDNVSAPLVPRIQNAAGSGFELRVDRADGSAAPISGVPVHCVAAEEGVYNTTDYGVNMEVVKYTSTVTDRAGSWVGESRAYANSYVSPVVIGQVMSYNDPAFSVFWARGSSRTAPPTSSTLFTGKNVAEDSNQTRADETVGYIVIESGTGTIGSLDYAAATGSDTIRGVGDAPPYSYAIGGPTSVSSAIVSAAAMDGGNGGWPVLYGASPVAGGSLQVAFDEDQIKDPERNHTTEQVAYLVFATTVPPPTLQSITVTPATPSIEAGQVQQFTATGNYSDGGNQDLTATAVWSSSNPGVATVNAAGLASGLTAGASNITATQDGVTSNIAVLTVTAPTLQSITVTPATPSIEAGQVQQFTATGNYSDGGNQDLTATAVWSSSNPGVATVNAAGLASGLTAGASNITATQDGVTSNIAVLTVTAPWPPPPPQVIVLQVTEGYDQKNGKTLSEDGKLNYVQANDMDGFETIPEFFTSYEFDNFIFPATAEIQSVEISVVHYEESSFGAGSLEWDAAQGPLTGPTTLLVMNPALRIDESAEGLDIFDASSVIDTPAKVNDLTLVVRNNDFANGKKTFSDHIFVTVRYTEIVDGQ